MTNAVTQTGHGFAVGDIVRYTGSAYTKAKADTDTDAEALGMVTTVTDADHFTLTMGGYVTGLSGLSAGSVYYLDPSTAGALTTTEPSATNQVSKPLLVAVSTTTGYLFNWRGKVIPAPAAGGSSDLLNWLEAR